MFQTWPGFPAPAPKHISLFVLKHILQNPHFLLAPTVQCSGFQPSALNPEKWHQKLLLSFHSAFYHL